MCGATSPRGSQLLSESGVSPMACMYELGHNTTGGIPTQTHTPDTANYHHCDPLSVRAAVGLHSFHFSCFSWQILYILKGFYVTFGTQKLMEKY